MDAGQMIMMQMPAGTAATVLPSSPTAQPAGNQGSGLFAGLLGGMVSQEAVASAAGAKDVAEPGNPVDGAVAPIPDMVTGLIAALLKEPPVAGTPVSTNMGHSGNMPAGKKASEAEDVSNKTPQDAAQNAAGSQPALVIQLNVGRMPVLDDRGAQRDSQAAKAEDAPDKTPQGVTPNAAGLQPAPVVQLNAARMPDAVAADAQQVVSRFLNTAAMPVGTTGREFSGNAGAAQSDDMVAVDAVQVMGTTTVAPRTAVQQPEPTVVQAKSARPEPTATPVATVRGDSTSMAGGQKRSAVVATLTAPGQTADGGRPSGTATLASFGVEVRAQQQLVILPRSAAVEAALADATQPSGAVAEKAAMSVADMIPGKANVATVSLQESPVVSPKAAQAVMAADTRTGRTLGETRSVPANATSEAGNKNADSRVETVQVGRNPGMAEKPLESVSADATKLAGVAMSGKEPGSGDERGATDQFMNGQFHPSQIHQQVKAENVGFSNTASVLSQSEAPRSDLSGQIASQVRDRLANHEAKPGSEQIVLKLSPENLGDLKLNMSLDGQKLKIEIVAENRMVRDALLQHTDSLKESLARQNISMESFDVTTNGRGAGNPGQGQQEAWRELARQNQRNAWMPADGYRLPDTPDLSSQLAYQAPSEHGMVDLHF